MTIPNPVMMAEQGEAAENPELHLTNSATLP